LKRYAFFDKIILDYSYVERDMKIKNLALMLCLLPIAAWAATGGNNARVGMTRSNSASGVRMSAVSNIVTKKVAAAPVVEQRSGASVASTQEEATEEDYEEEEVVEETKKEITPENCREFYQACMDDFCLLDETEGSRCACSDNIEKSKSLIQQIQKIQSEADDLYTTGVEREKLGAKARLVFGESEAAKKSKSGIDFSAWLNGGDDADADVGEDMDIGQNLYAMALDACKEELKACGAKAKAEETLYSRKITADCKSFSTYLNDQKREAEMNKKTAEAAVRSARLEMLNTTNKYNRGECLLVYRSCIADKGGCGVNFENCLDEDLLARRSHACEDVLDQCMAVRKDVLKDWQEESVAVLKDAAKYADKNQRATCLAKIQNCLEEGCSTSTNSACLTDVNVAAGICPIITECNEKIPGLQTVINDKLGYLQTKFCENDLDSCLKDKCGTDFTKPECVGKNPTEIAALCPQSMFPSCKGATQYDVLVSSAMLHMDYQLLTGCINQFAEKLTAVCGADMTCIPVSKLLPAVDKWVDLNSTEGKKILANAESAANRAVDEFFADFGKDLTLSACQDIYGKNPNKIKDKTGMQDSVNMTAKMIAYTNARARADRELASVMNDLKIKEETDRNRKYCMRKFQQEQEPDKEGSYSYIRSATYEPSLQSCHVCRMQRVCEKGGEKKSTSALKAAAGGLSAGASAGTMVSPGWGTAIGAAVGAIGAGVMGAISGGEEEFCQELESCEDINIAGVTQEELDELQ
jgi:hypothetical protein